MMNIYLRSDFARKMGFKVVLSSGVAKKGDFQTIPEEDCLDKSFLTILTKVDDFISTSNSRDKHFANRMGD